MSDDFPLMRPRTIGRIGERTPLILPSFSSRGFACVEGIVQSVQAQLYGPCLVSAYDVARGHISADLAALGDIVVVDSGGYETGTYLPALGEWHAPSARSAWSRADLRAFLRSLTPAMPVVVVAFDEHADIETQLACAHDDFACAPSAARCLLLKPTERNSTLDVDVPIPAEVRELEVVGVTEDELGTNLVERCRALVRLRMMVGPVVPIHVFGTITPGSMLAFTLCGADVFDGLNWLRYVYDDGLMRAIAGRALRPEHWEQRDDLLRAEVWRANLRWLSRYQTWLRSVVDREPGALESSPAHPEDVASCLALAHRCGASEDR